MMKMHGQTTLKRGIFVVTVMRISHIAIKIFKEDKSEGKGNLP